MIFTSVTFIFAFLPIVLLLYFISRDKVRNIVLCAASLVFYAWGEPVYIILMLCSIAINYILGLIIGRKQSKLFMTIGVIINLVALVIFKYSSFLIENVNAIAGSQIFPNPNIELPIGISFYTFQAMSYLIDVYRGEVKSQKNPLNFALYISLFPQLIAGPIVRYSTIADEINSRTISFDDVYCGSMRFVVGYAKKMLISNQLALVADRIFALPSDELFMGLSWIGIICYSLQILFDFSGYSDMAIGLGRIFGFHFNENFNDPYAASSIQDFWRRWHISLSSWFRDYLYIPLGGNRKGVIRTYFNQIIVFTLCGFWHGAQWTFLIWGLYHGLFLTFEKIPVIKNTLKKLPRLVCHIYALIIVMIGWVFFRCDTLSQGFTYIGAMFGFNGIVSHSYYFNEFMTTTSWLALIAGVVFCVPWKSFLEQENIKKVVVKLEPVKCVTLLVIFVVSIIFTAASVYNPFIYFRF